MNHFSHIISYTPPKQIVFGIRGWGYKKIFYTSPKFFLKNFFVRGWGNENYFYTPPPKFKKNTIHY